MSMEQLYEVVGEKRGWIGASDIKVFGPFDYLDAQCEQTILQAEWGPDWYFYIREAQGI